MRNRWSQPALLLLLLGMAGGCKGQAPSAPAKGETTPSTPASAPGAAPTAVAPPPAPEPEPPDEDALPEAEGLPRDRVALQVVAGKDRWVDAEAAVARGLTLVDLSDDFAPYIFRDGKDAKGHILPNRYRAVFVGLANDRCDGDGDPLPPGEKNYLELYGIPPSLSVLRRRFLEDAGRACETQLDTKVLLGVDGIETFGRSTEKKEATKHLYRGKRLAAAMQQAGKPTLEALAEKDPRYAREVKEHLRVEAERAAFAEVEKRMVCEGLMDPAKHTPGSYDGAMRTAVLSFQQKNAIFAQADLTRGTLEAMAKSALENDFQALLRSLTERVAHAGGFIEDGSAREAMPPPRRGKPRAEPTYATADGKRAPVPDLVGQGLLALQARLRWRTAAEALAFFQRHPEKDFQRLRVAVRFPPLPEYYGPHMDLLAEIDRGDVWYDFPYDAKGNRLPQPRRAYPSFTLFVKWRNEKVPLLHWRTTIGGWRTEVAADGQTYYRYKDSDVGPRVWRHVIAAPVWLPPSSAPLSAMVKTKYVAGGYPKVVNYDETGPGYLSAYGLVAGVHVKARKREGGTTYNDNGIRTHGSFDYLSLRGRFSHGCHRLYNNLAVRMFSFVLAHRKNQVIGPVALGFRRTFYLDGEVFDMRLPTRGFYFELTPPLPIETLKGNIKGTLQAPITEYVPKPGVAYPSTNRPAAGSGAESRAGGEP